MADVLTAAQMRRIEESAIASGAVTGATLMERAGQGVVDAILAHWPELNHSEDAGSGMAGEGAVPTGLPLRAVVLCGPGNNGGDGFVIARLLKRKGWAVEVFLFGDPLRLTGDAKLNYTRWCALGAVQSDLDLIDRFADAGLEADLFVDAIFGTGLTRALPDRLADLLGKVTGCRTVRTVAVDIASGICTDSGRMLQPADPQPAVSKANFDLTVTFHRAKRGHLSQEGALASGHLAIVDIGLDLAHQTLRRKLAVPSLEDAFLGSISHWVGQTDDANPAFDVPLAGVLAKDAFGHKFRHGHALVFSGETCKTGAARLAARGALRIGAGLVTLAVPGNALSEVAAQVTAIMIAPVSGSGDALNLLQDSRLNALCIGPGLGVALARSLVPIALKQTRAVRRSVVLDADALTAFAAAPDDLFALLHSNCVLTPHFGEFTRLFPDLAQKLVARPTHGPAYSRYDAVCEAADRAGCVVLLKGPDTVIASPEGQVSVNAALFENQAPWLATAGSGDVLAGFITGLMARGVPAMRAAEMGVWLHAQCGRSLGPGLIAEDLPEELPNVFRSILS